MDADPHSGFELRDDVVMPVYWWAVVFSLSMPYRLAPTLLASGLTVAFLIAGLPAFHWLRGDRAGGDRVALTTSVGLAALLIPIHIFVGDLHGLNILERQPAKVAAMEGNWDTGPKATAKSKPAWNAVFLIGCFLTALSQRFMLGIYIMGLEITGGTLLFATAAAVFTAICHSHIGAAWLVLKTQNVLQQKTVRWARSGLFGVVLGIASVSIASPMVSQRTYDKWFRFPELVILAPLPIVSVGLVIVTWLVLRHLPMQNDALSWMPFTAGVSLFILAFAGLAYSFYTYVVPEKITLYEAASAPEALWVMLIGALIIMPIITAYTALAYFAFRGKRRLLSYN